MTDDLDAGLQALFADAQQELPGVEFSARVMAAMRFRRYRGWAGLACAALALVACAGLFAVPLQEVALVAARSLTTSLIDLGDSWWALIFSPINSIASVVVLSVKGIRMARNKARGASTAAG